MWILAKQDLFKNYLHLQPSETQFWTTIIVLPFVFKFLYGVVADQCPIFGSRKKSYMIIMGLIQFVCMMMCSFIRSESPAFVATLFIILNTANAFMDVVIDALMVIQAKKYPLDGSQQLISF